MCGFLKFTVHLNMGWKLASGNIIYM